MFKKTIFTFVLIDAEYFWKKRDMDRDTDTHTHRELTGGCIWGRSGVGDIGFFL